MARLDVVARRGEIQVPTIAVAGQQDRSAVPEALKAIADGVPNCRDVLIDPGTNMMPMEQPDALAAALFDFGNEIDGTADSTTTTQAAGSQRAPSDR